LYIHDSDVAKCQNDVLYSKQSMSKIGGIRGV